MKFKLGIFLLATALFFGLTAFKKGDPLEELLKKLKEFTQRYPQEKIHLHLDKPYYAAGDDIWFKTYVIDARTNIPTSHSQIVYVQLINERNTISKELKLPMAGGIAWADFKLEDTLSEGNYRIRAYTQLMRNAGEDFFFEKPLKIGNAWTNRVFTKTTNKYSNDANGEKVTATIRFVDSLGKPYINAKVGHTVTVNQNVATKGSATTNKNGEINVQYTNTKGVQASRGLITASIQLPNGATAVKNISFRPQSNFDVQFLPEGGAFVKGLPCRIAIKATNANGFGQDISGVVVDQNGTEIQQFSTSYLGMGSFVFTANEEKSFTALVKLPDGSTKTIALPVAEKSGYALSINNSDSTKLIAKAMISENLINQGELTLVAQRNGEVFYSTQLSTAKQIATIAFPKLTFPSGIIQFTLFSPTQQPVAERIAFINNLSNQVGIAMEGLKPIYSKKEKANLTLFATNNLQPTQGSFSISVTNTAIVTADTVNETNILTNLLLTSDLKGYVEKPNHYFKKNDLATRIQLDHLLLTQGWRKLDWKQVMSTQLANNAFPIEKSMRLSGNVTTRNNKPVAKGKVVLFSSGKNKLFVTTETDQQGHFSFEEMSFGDSTQFAVQASTASGNKDVKVKLDHVAPVAITAGQYLPELETNVNAYLDNYLKKSNTFFDEQYKKGFLNRVNTLKTVNIVQKVKREDSAAVHSSNYNGRGKADRIITANDLKNTESLATYFAQGRVMGVSDSAGYPYTTRKVASMQQRSDGSIDVPLMAISIDGLIVQDFSLRDFPVNEIESVEVLLSIGYTAVYGPAAENGLIIITTKQGKGLSAADVYAPGLAVTRPKGYDVPRLFYSPQYDVNPTNQPDLRTTVYWNPNVISNPDGKAVFSYFNTDQPGNYRVVVEGIDINGYLAHQTFMYTVK